MAAIHHLVRQLAIYEKAPEAHVATVADYERDFLDGKFESIVAEEDGVVVGMVLFYDAYSTWKGRMLYLDDFVVAEERRGAGIGKLLFEAFLDEARKRGCKLAKWQVLDWNEPAINFYQKYPVFFDKEWIDVKIPFN